MVRLRKPMPYPLSYEGITGFSSPSLWSRRLHSTTPAQEVMKNSPLATITPHYSSMRTVGDD